MGTRGTGAGSCGIVAHLCSRGRGDRVPGPCRGPKAGCRAGHGGPGRDGLAGDLGVRRAPSGGTSVGAGQGLWGVPGRRHPLPAARRLGASHPSRAQPRRRPVGPVGALQRGDDRGVPRLRRAAGAFRPAGLPGRPHGEGAGCSRGNRSGSAPRGCRRGPSTRRGRAMGSAGAPTVGRPCPPRSAGPPPGSRRGRPCAG